jgi:hypothetical protein
MTRKQASRSERDRARPAEREPVPTWRNTRPRGNQEPDRRDLNRGVERLEMLLGR